MMDLLTLFDTVGSASDLCDAMAPGLRIVGIVVLGIRIAVPIILIVVGMLDLAKAVTEKSEDNIKKAQQGLIKKAIAAGHYGSCDRIVYAGHGVCGRRDRHRRHSAGR